MERKCAWGVLLFSLLALVLCKSLQASECGDSTGSSVLGIGRNIGTQRDVDVVSSQHPILISPPGFKENNPKFLKKFQKALEEVSDSSLVLNNEIHATKEARFSGACSQQISDNFVLDGGHAVDKTANSKQSDYVQMPSTVSDHSLHNGDNSDDELKDRAEDFSEINTLENNAVQLPPLSPTSSPTDVDKASEDNAGGETFGSDRPSSAASDEDNFNVANDLGSSQSLPQLVVVPTQKDPFPQQQTDASRLSQLSSPASSIHESAVGELNSDNFVLDDGRVVDETANSEQFYHAQMQLTEPNGFLDDGGDGDDELKDGAKDFSAINTSDNNPVQLPQLSPTSTTEPPTSSGVTFGSESSSRRNSTTLSGAADNVEYLKVHETRSNESQKNPLQPILPHGGFDNKIGTIVTKNTTSLHLQEVSDNDDEVHSRTVGNVKVQSPGGDSSSLENYISSPVQDDDDYSVIEDDGISGKKEYCEQFKRSSCITTHHDDAKQKTRFDDEGKACCAGFAVAMAAGFSLSHFSKMDSLKRSKSFSLLCKSVEDGRNAQGLSCVSKVFFGGKSHNCFEGDSSCFGKSGIFSTGTKNFAGETANSFALRFLWARISPRFKKTIKNCLIVQLIDKVPKKMKTIGSAIGRSVLIKGLLHVEGRCFPFFGQKSSTGKAGNE